MFKYGSFRHFLIKVFMGALLISIGIFSIVSLYTYNSADPGFNTFSNNSSAPEINNYFGSIGAYASSYLIIIFGHFAYIFSLFVLFVGLGFFLGVKITYLIFRFLLNILGVLLIGASLYIYNFQFIELGLVHAIFFNLLNEVFLTYFNNDILIKSLFFIIFIFSFYLILVSFSIKLNRFYKLLAFFKIFKFLKFVRYILPINILSKLFKRNPKRKFLKNKTEPTIRNKKTRFFQENEETIKSKYKQLEINQFKYSLPETNLLLKSLAKNSFIRELDKINNESAIKLQKTLSEYGVEGKVTSFKSGPIVTLFEFIPNAGIKSSKVIGLADDIARAMSSLSARISSQPGKTSLGIEIPNLKRDGVMFGDLVNDALFNLDNESLTLALGKDISGEKIYANLEKMPHLLIAGTTGSGKSVGINTMILSLLYKFKPNECKLIMIDPKMLELSIYEDIPHLLTPVVTDPKKAVYALKWVVREMENRYKLMSSVNVKNIESYNNKVARTIASGRKLYREVQTGIDTDTRMPILEKREIPLDRMPFIVVVIDEMADLMMVAGKEVESLVQRLAQMARASGIHLIMATQRPSVDVITGTIKANFPSRISYKVASKFDSRTILNEMGAEQLLGSGDMLFLENGGTIKRLHGGFVSESEVEKIVNFIKGQATFDHKKEISLEDVNTKQGFENDLITENTDELYSKAVEIVVEQQKVSTSYIQRYLQIGYNRAARIVEKMEEDGIITEANNAGKRSVIKKN